MRLNLYITQEALNPKNIQVDLSLRAKNNNTIDTYYYDEDGLSVDITGSELYFMVKATPSTSDASAILNKKITSFTNPTSGHAEIELTSADTGSLVGNYIYQIKIKYLSKWYSVAEGNITFMQSIITRES